MRVNMEDSAKRHLPRLARAMGWSIREVMGALCFVWGATQEAEVYEDTPERIETLCALDFDDDDQCRRFITAMIGAQLIAVLDDGRLRIRGNEYHVNRLRVLRKNAPKGGKARQDQIRNDFVADSEPSPSHDRAVAEPDRSAPSSLLLTPNTNTAPGPINGVTPYPTDVGDLPKGKKTKTGTRRAKSNPRSLGTNPRAKRKAAREAARVAQLERLASLRETSAPPNAEGLAEIAALKKKLRIS